MKPIIYDKIAATPKIIDNERVTIKIPAVYRYGDNEWVIKTELFNKLPNAEIEVVVESVSVNGVQSFPRFDERVSAGDTYESEIVLERNEIDSKIIGEYSDIEIDFCIYLPKLYYEEGKFYEKINLYPLGKRKAARYVRQPQPNDAIILDDDYSTVTVTGYGYNPFNTVMNFFVVNKSNDSLMFFVDEVKMDGVEREVIGEFEVIKGKSGFCEIFWLDDILWEGVKKLELTIEENVESSQYGKKISVAKKTVTLYPNIT